MLLRMYVVSDKLKEAKKPYKQNLKHVDDEGVFWRDKLTFYYYSWIYNTKRSKEKEAADIKAKYDALKQEMQSKGNVI
jgi:hypothetical protein